MLSLIYKLLYLCKGVIIARFILNKAAASPLIPARAKEKLERGFLILYYHRVNSEADPYFEATPTDVFEEQIKYLSREYRILPLDELAALAGENKTPKNSIAITFDDGYRDNLTDAYPILKRYSAPATIFLPTGYIGSGQIPIWDKLSYNFKRTKKNSLSISIRGQKRYELNSRPQRLLAMRDTMRDIHQSRTEDEKRMWIEKIGAILEVEDSEELSGGMLDWDEVKSMMSGGVVRFGAHTVSHPDLTKLSADEVLREMAASKAEIEKRLGIEVTTFAYPRGDFNAVVRDLAQRAGFRCACSTVMGKNTAYADPFALKRITSIEAPIEAFSVLLEWLRYFPRERENQHGM
ncbi:MAG: polysaccharide deacetylase family protein [Deltaproteobacteria bacterium]